ncbi:2-iminobutanoate/2-iminopropanoate deaminase [Entomoplasma freundtii]|uniref:TdcF protein n=1 Tax=Entomoplasma freundtii TaxID=74700 RepID=A0A2K8NU43_9MOLU|nr:RidA family protein [Entomoplasma freundtii]ATZ16281.1 TdcF protein [Entomoplasma freundtii]TDY56817.1 2-iminobutanoate/2-iminopropanoate deaminase [Entomoplasma freundtii]
MKIIETDKAPKAVGPYSQAIQLENGFLYTSGQLGLNPETMKMPEKVTDQAWNALENIDNILIEAGYTKNDVVKTLVLLADIKDFVECNKIYTEYFGDHKPARSAFQVAALPLGGKIEIEAIAYKE